MPVTDVVCDASIVLKWFQDEGEKDGGEARVLLSAHQAGLLTAWILDLTLYGVGNVLLRGLGWPAADVAAQLDDLGTICPSLTLGTAELRLAAQLAEEHALTFHDAAYAAAARSRGAALATADMALLDAGAGVSPKAIAPGLGL